MSSISEQSVISESSLEPTEHQLLSLFEPFIYKLDQTIDSCLRSQTQLNSELDSLLVTLNAIKANPDLSAVIEDKTKRLLALKRRLTLIHTIVQNSNDRTRKLINNYRVNDNQNKS